jgi:hypothetical protein
MPQMGVEDDRARVLIETSLDGYVEVDGQECIVEWSVQTE